MRRLVDSRTGVVTVTAVSAALVGSLVFAALGLLAGPAPGPDPVEAANPGSVAPGPDGSPPLAGPSAGPSAPPSKSSTTGRSLSPGVSGGTPSPSAASHADAPSENLRRLADALRFSYKSTTGAMVAPAGLNLTSPVEISVLWDEGGPRPTRATQDYNNTTGNRSIFLFPAGDGRARAVGSVVTLAERRTDGAVTYAVRSRVTIEPLYDITVSSLVFTLLTDCDLLATDVRLYWLGADGGGGQFRRGMHENESATVTDFARTYREVGQSSNLLVPLIVFYDHDPYDFRGPPGANTNGPLPLGADRTIDFGLSDPENSACVARVRYGVKFQLREYLYLE